jgi:hypothetical protein
MDATLSITPLVKKFWHNRGYKYLSEPPYVSATLSTEGGEGSATVLRLIRHGTNLVMQCLVCSMKLEVL